VRFDPAALWRWVIALMTIGFIGRVIRYGIVGVTVAALYSLAIVALVPVVRPFSPTVATVIAFCLTLPIGFWMHRRFSFADRAAQDGQALRFTLTNVASFVISVGGMYVVTEMLHLSYLYGIAWTWAAVPGINFGIYLFWVFRHPGPADTQKDLIVRDEAS